MKKIIIIFSALAICALIMRSYAMDKKQNESLTLPAAPQPVQAEQTFEQPIAVVSETEAAIMPAKDIAGTDDDISALMSALDETTTQTPPVSPMPTIPMPVIVEEKTEPSDMMQEQFASLASRLDRIETRLIAIEERIANLSQTMITTPTTAPVAPKPVQEQPEEPMITPEEPVVPEPDMQETPMQEVPQPEAPMTETMEQEVVEEMSPQEPMPSTEPMFDIPEETDTMHI